MSNQVIKRPLSEQEMSNLVTHLQNQDEARRGHLAREIHDELGGLLAASKMDLAWIRARLQLKDPAIELRWTRSMSALDQCITVTRRMTDTLRPSLLDNLGLVAALHWLAERQCQEAGINLREEYANDVDSLTPDASINLFRVAQEAMENLVRHASAKEMFVKISRDRSDVVLGICDNGKGIGLEQLLNPKSHGLSDMRHRMATIGGSLDISRATQGEGTVVTARLSAERALLAS